MRSQEKTDCQSEQKKQNRSENQCKWLLAVSNSDHTPDLSRLFNDFLDHSVHFFHYIDGDGRTLVYGLDTGCQVFHLRIQYIRQFDQTQCVRGGLIAFPLGNRLTADIQKPGKLRLRKALFLSE